MLRFRRGVALIRVMFETGMRAGEVVALGVEDVDLRAGGRTLSRTAGRPPAARSPT